MRDIMDSKLMVRDQLMEDNRLELNFNHHKALINLNVAAITFTSHRQGHHPEREMGLFGEDTTMMERRREAMEGK